MEKFLSILLSITALSIFSALYTMLFPEGKLKKVGNFILSVSILLLCISTFVNNISDFHVSPLELKAETKQEGKNIQKESYEKAVIQKLNEALHQQDIAAESIRLSSEIDEDGYLVLKEVDIELEDIYNPESVKKILFEAYEIPEDIICFISKEEEKP